MIINKFFISPFEIFFENNNDSLSTIRSRDMRKCSMNSTVKDHRIVVYPFLKYCIRKVIFFITPFFILLVARKSRHKRLSAPLGSVRAPVERKTKL